MQSLLKYLLCLAANSCLLFSAYGQNYRISDITDSLKKDAHAVIRFDSAYVDVQNEIGYTYTEVKIISVLDASMENLAVIGLPYSDREEITNFKAWLYDADGNLIKRSEANEMADISNSGINLASSGRVKMLNMQKQKAPFTIKYSFNRLVSGTAFMPRWVPVTDFNQSVEHAELTVHVKQGMHINFNANNLAATDSSDNLFIWQLNSFTPLKKEEYGLVLQQVLPRMDMMADKFELYSITGSSATWNDIGHFINAIARDNVDLKKVNERELNNIFESRQTDIEKIKALYSYLQHNFHYAGIETGIAGWKPEDALATMKKKYGDCKGLVTVLKALLKKAGIESYYTLINADNAPLVKTAGFPLLDFNHVILCVPLQHDTIWLECTSPIAPFNYLYNITSGRTALLVYDGGARLISTPEHNENYNRCGSMVHIKLNTDNASVINAVVSRRGDLQDTLRQVSDQNNQKLTEAVIYHGMHLKNTSINSFSIKQVDPDSPLVVITMALGNESAIRKTDARIFLKTDLFSPVPAIPQKTESRTQPVNVTAGYTQTDTLIYSLPADYIPENFKAGETKIITGKFGSADYALTYSPVTGELQVTRRFCLKTGTYPKDQYAAFRDFLLQSAKTTCPELVLRKKG